MRQNNVSIVDIPARDSVICHDAPSGPTNGTVQVRDIAHRRSRKAECSSRAFQIAPLRPIPSVDERVIRIRSSTCIVPSDEETGIPTSNACQEENSENAQQPNRQAVSQR